MALAKRKARPEPLFVVAKRLTPSAGHPFNQKLNQLLDEDRVDAPLHEDVQAPPETAHLSKTCGETTPPAVADLNVTFNAEL
jgi:hypothetical protein